MGRICHVNVPGMTRLSEKPFYLLEIRVSAPFFKTYNPLWEIARPKTDFICPAKALLFQNHQVTFR